MKKSAIWTVLAFLGTLACFSASAQNAAQKQALTRIGRTRLAIHAEYTPPNNVEASSVSLDQPSGLTFDSAGNLYIADTLDNVILEVNTSGIVNTVAGVGAQGFGGDGAAATGAQLDSPVGVAVDGSGNIYIADTNNNRVREVLVSTGIISTIAGTGVAGFFGDGNTATAAQLDQPTGIAVDSNGNVYVVDTNNNRIREISGGNIKTVAGNGQQTFSGDGVLATATALNEPTGVAMDAAFNIYIGDTLNQRVRKVAFATGIISTIAGTGVQGLNGDGPVATTELDGPAGIAVDVSGNVYITDSNNNLIREIAGGSVTTIAGNGQQGFIDFIAATSAELNTPLDVSIYGSTVAFADTLNNSIGEVIAGKVDTVAGVAASGSESLTLSGPTTINYGTGTLTATFSYNSQIATGLVTFYDGLVASPTQVGQSPLSANAAVLNTSTLAAGTHNIVASYAGDAKNPAIASGIYVLIVKPAALTAVAKTVNLFYGQTIPTLTGTLNGVLAQDSGNVTAVYSTTATSTSAPGTYPITVKITGSAAANYTVTLGPGSGSLIISKAPTTTTLAVSATPILGVPVTLTASVASTTTGTPTGTVSFYNGTTLLNSTPATVTSGVATFIATTIPVGPVSLTAVYSGDTDFVTSTSVAYLATEISADFTISALPGTLAVVPTQAVSSTITLTPVNSTFVFPVSLSASGLPSGVTASFVPASIAAGAGTSTSVLTLSASAQAQLQKDKRPFGWPGYSAALALFMFPLIFGKRARRVAARFSRAGKYLIALLALAAAVAFSGCGGGGFFGHATTSYTVTVTAVCGPNTHTATVNLTVQ